MHWLQAKYSTSDIWIPREQIINIKQQSVLLEAFVASEALCLQ